MTIASVCTGIGGLDLGLQWAGWGDVLWQAEPDTYCRTILMRHWPKAKRFHHAQAVPRNAARPDVFAFGFPCQDISVAGKGAGLDGDRSGLWWECLRIVDDLRPGCVVVENVAALQRRGLDVVAAGLRMLGYQVACARIEAADVGAPHHRQRLFIVGALANSDSVRELQPSRPDADIGRRSGGSGSWVPCVCGEWVCLIHGGHAADCPCPPVDEWDCDPYGDLVDFGDVGDTDSERLEIACDWPGPADADATPGGASGGAAGPGLGGVPDGLPAGLVPTFWPAGRGVSQYDWEPPRTIAPGECPWRQDAVTALGNAVVPQVAYQAGRFAAHWCALVRS